MPDRHPGVRCEDVSPLLGGVVAGDVDLSAAQRQHVEHCLRCQAEVVQHRRILRTMRQLRDELIDPAPGLLPDMLAQVHDIGERSAVRSLVSRRYVRYSAAIVGLGAAAVTGTVLTIRWRRSSANGDGTRSATPSGTGTATGTGMSADPASGAG